MIGKLYYPIRPSLQLRNELTILLWIQHHEAHIVLLEQVQPMMDDPGSVIRVIIIGQEIILW